MMKTAIGTVLLALALTVVAQDKPRWVPGFNEEVLKTKSLILYGSPGTITSSGGITSSGDLTASDVVASEDVIAGDDMVVGDDLTVTDRVTCADAVVTDDLIVGDDAWIADDLVVTDRVTCADAYVTDDLFVTDDAEIGGDVTITGSLVVTGKMSSAYLSGILCASMPVTVTASTTTNVAITVQAKDPSGTNLARRQGFRFWFSTQAVQTTASTNDVESFTIANGDMRLYDGTAAAPTYVAETDTTGLFTLNGITTATWATTNRFHLLGANGYYTNAVVVW